MPGIAYEKDGTGIPEQEPLILDSEPEWSVIFDAPDYQKLLKPPSTQNAREYETKLLSVMKEALRYRLTPDGLPDAAAILRFGPSLAARGGVLADTDPRAAKAIDILTAPDSPWIMLGLVAIPFISQLFRNHEAQVQAIPAQMKKGRAQRKAERAARPAAYVKIPGMKRRIRVPFKIKLSLGFFRASTADPGDLVRDVFSNADLRKALHKTYGVSFGGPDA
jgi:hypothetical protein